MVKVAKLVPTLKAEGYELLMRSRPSDCYDVRKGSDIVGGIRVHLKCVEANTGTEISYVPYDLDIDVLDGFADMPIDLFKKMIMATVTIS